MTKTTRKLFNEEEFSMYNKIIAAFETPTQKKIRELQHEKFLHERAAGIIQGKITRLRNKLDKEQDHIADKLDRSVPTWRRLILRAVKL